MMKRSAILSDNEVYQYTLDKTCHDQKERVLFVMLTSQHRGRKRRQRHDPALQGLRQEVGPRRPRSRQSLRAEVHGPKSPV